MLAHLFVSNRDKLICIVAIRDLSLILVLHMALFLITGLSDLNSFVKLPAAWQECFFSNRMKVPIYGSGRNVRD
jgi:hypothetical protein